MFYAASRSTRFLSRVSRDIGFYAIDLLPPAKMYRPLPPNFVQALVTYADVKGAAGLQEISDQFDALYADVKAGNGKTLITSAPSGKSFTFEVNASVEELFTAYAEALRELKTDSSGKTVATYADFSALQR